MKLKFGLTITVLLALILISLSCSLNGKISHEQTRKGTKTFMKPQIFTDKHRCRNDENNLILSGFYQCESVRICG